MTSTQATASTSMDVASSEDIDDSLWSSLWLSGWDFWDFWAEACPTEERSAETAQAHSPETRGTRSVRRARRTLPGGQSPSPGIETRSTSTKAGDQHVCTVCNQSFPSVNGLKLHSKAHDGGRPWKCDECGACFARKDHLRVHFRVHTGERPYSCMICGNSFAHSGTLKSHIRTHTGEKPFACDACGVSFSDPSTLRMHRLKHLGVKSFACSDCDGAFGSSGLLDKHRQMHPNGGCVRRKRGATVGRRTPSKMLIEERLFPCNVCGRLFKSERFLSLHVRSHPVGESRPPSRAEDESGTSLQPLETYEDVRVSEVDGPSDQFQDRSFFSGHTAK